MALSTVRRAGLVDQVIAQIRVGITKGDWPVGQRIPNETELVQTLGVGRNTVREAVRGLAHAGILEVRQGDGTYVRATSEVSGALGRLCGTELEEILQVRRGLEVEGARLAASNRTDEELAELRALLAKSHHVAGGPLDEAAAADAEFHLAVVRCSHNTILIELYQGLIEAVAASVEATADIPGHEVVHTALIEHIAAGDHTRAAQAAGTLVDHMLSGVRRR
ncbi:MULTISPECIES: FCD domain-containing protein [Rhodococcus]|uniref:FCD domain-containing protein n=1 Tax=Rhodococcus sp. A14 TaxID=1194106 RepID=UPI0010642CB4|nr:FadR family transcriptional regulator [Rhodococcus sp. A14]